MATDGECDLEIRTIVHKGEYKWCKFNAAIGRYDEDNTPIFHAMITDITQIKKAEESADKMSDMLVEMFKIFPIRFLHRHRRYLAASNCQRGFYKIFGIFTFSYF